MKAIASFSGSHSGRSRFCRLVGSEDNLYGSSEVYHVDSSVSIDVRIGLLSIRGRALFQDEVHDSGHINHVNRAVAVSIAQLDFGATIVTGQLFSSGPKRVTCSGGRSPCQTTSDEEDKACNMRRKE